MERVLSNSQMREADLYTIEKLGVCQDELVERAGKALFDEINKRFFGGRVLVCVGKGNNGADGKILAKLLSNKHGYNLNIFNVENGNFKIFENKFDIIVDCIFGTGLNKVVEGRYKKAVDFISDGSVDMNLFVTNVIRLEEFEKGLELARKRPVGFVKAVFKFDE